MRSLLHGVHRDQRAPRPTLRNLLLFFVCNWLLSIVCGELGDKGLNTDTAFHRVVDVPLAFHSTVGPWFCTPDPETDLSVTLKGDSRSDESDDVSFIQNRQLLSSLGIPFVFDTQDDDFVLCFRHILAFRSVEHGVTPQVWLIADRLAPGLRYYYYAMLPEELERRFGSARLAALAVLDTAWQWKAVESPGGATGDRLHEADAFIDTLPDPPQDVGFVTVRTSLGAVVQSVEIPLCDIHLRDVGEAGALPAIEFDIQAAAERVYRRRRVRAKRRYAALIAEHDEAVRREAAEVVEGIWAEVHRAQKEYATEKRRRESYDVFRQEQLARLRQERERATLDTSSLASTSAAVEGDLRWRRRTTPFLLRHGHREAAKESKKAAVCHRLTKALSTLHAQPVGGIDSRRIGLEALLEKRGCALPVEEDMATSPATKPALLSPRMCSLYCSGLDVLQEWGEFTGQPATTPQLLSFFLSLYTNVTLADDPSATPDSASVKAESVFDATGRLRMDTFATWLHSVFTAVNFRSCACEAPQRLRAEMYHTAALVDLLLARQTEDRSVGSHTARAVLHIHQALWLGSTQAAATLSTMRELGIFVSQNLKASQALLTQSMRGVSGGMYGELWRELLDKRRGRAESSDMATTAVPSPGIIKSKGVGVAKSVLHKRIDAARHGERVLRQERMYAVSYSWTDLDKPFATKDLIQQFFAVDDHHFDEIDEETGETVRREVANSVLQEEEEGGAADTQGPFGAIVRNQLSKASLFAHGFRVRRNVHAAECLLLGVLRKFDYMCDIHLLAELRRRQNGTGDAAVKGDSPNWAEDVIAETRSVCPLHADDLDAALRRPRARRLPCPWPKGRDGSQRRGPPFPVVKQNFETLLHSLTTLAYVYLTTGEYGKAAVYAHLAVQLSASVYFHATRPALWKGVHVPEDLIQFIRSYGSANGAAAQWPIISRTLPRPWNTWWMRDMFTGFARFDEDLLYAVLSPTNGGEDHRVRFEREKETAPFTWWADGEPFPLALVDSPFLVNEPLVILSMAVLLDDAEPAEQTGTDTLAMLAAKETLRHTFVLRGSSADRGGDAAPEEILSRHSLFTPCWHPGAAVKPTSSTTPLGKRKAQQQTAFVLLSAAAAQWRGVYKGGHVFDHTFYSVHSADPFHLLTWLLRDMEKTVEAEWLHASASVEGADENERQCVSIPSIRRLLDALTPHVVGARPFTPLPHDTVESFVRRIDRFTMQNVRVTETFTDAFHGGRAHVDAQAKPMVDGDKVRRGKIISLREARQLTIDPAHFTPLLYASDTQAYLARSSGWTLLARAADSLVNAFYYLFTETRGETLTREMGVEVLSTIPRNRLGQQHESLPPAATDASMASSVSQGTATLVPFWDNTHRPESPAWFIRDFTELFQSLPEIREVSVAVQLLAATLESGLPEGFSLLLLEASSPRDNAYVKPFVDYLAATVFGPVTAAMWLEEHVTAQWHRDKPETRQGSSALTLNAHTPFRYVYPEVRQELMARVDVWRAAKLQKSMEDAPASAVNTAHGREESATQANGWRGAVAKRNRRQTLLQVTEILSRCTGAIPHASLRRWLAADPLNTALTLPRSPYEGMLFPAGDPLCAEELLKVLRQLDADGVVRFGNTETSLYLDRVLGQMLTRLSLFYNLTREDFPRRMLPSTNEEFGEANTEEPDFDDDDNLDEEDYDEEDDDEGWDVGIHDEDDTDTDAAEEGRVGGTDYVPLGRWKPHFLVEPWAAVTAAGQDQPPASLPRKGEGTFYFSRLHRVSGYRAGARLQSMWYWGWSLFTR